MSVFIRLEETSSEEDRFFLTPFSLLYLLPFYNVFLFHFLCFLLVLRLLLHLFFVCVFVFGPCSASSVFFSSFVFCRICFSCVFSSMVRVLFPLCSFCPLTLCPVSSVIFSSFVFCYICFSCVFSSTVRVLLPLCFSCHSTGVASVLRVCINPCPVSSVFFLSFFFCYICISCSPLSTNVLFQI